jgi:hypothetical protein
LLKRKYTKENTKMKAKKMMEGGEEKKNLPKKVKERPKSQKERKPQKEIIKATTFSKSPRRKKIKE